MNTKQSAALGVAILSAVLLAGCASQTPAAAPAAPAGSDASPDSGSSPDVGALATAPTALGTIVVDGSGMTVYFYDKDVKDESASVCTGACASAWPPVLSSSSTPSVTGVTGTVGTIAGPGGKQQVTIDGLPIYTYAADGKAGDVLGQGSNGIWWAVNPDGTENKGDGSSPSSDGRYSY